MKNFLLTLLFFTPLMLNAALITYNGGGVDPTDWNDGANWDGGVAPGPTDDALISGGSATLSGTFTAASLELSSGADLIIDAGAVLNLGGDDGVDTNGAFDISSSSATVINNGTINVTGAAEDGIDHRGQSFINNGDIVITGYGNDGLSVEDASSMGGIFTNNGNITVTATGGGDEALQVDDGSFLINSGTITVSSSDCSGDMGLYLDDSSFFTNTATGVLSIADIVDEGILVEPGSVLNNSGLITTENIGQCSNEGNHGLDLQGTFNNNAGGTYKDINPRGDNIRGGAAGVFLNNGTLVLDLASNTSDGIDTEAVPGLSFSGPGVIEIGCLSTTNEIEINGDLDLGAACINFDIAGTGAGTTFDRIENKNGTVTIGAATAKLDWGTYVPEVGDCFKIVDGQTTNVGLRSGEFVAITSSNPAITFDVDYSDPAEVEICVTALALPVELTTFFGKMTDQGANLNWATASEINNKGFEIERSSDSERWTNIGFVLGNGTVNTSVQYDFVDKTPSRGINYYRLKQVDFDGAFEYSDIIALDFEGDKGGISIYPNPVGTVLNVSMSETLEDVQVQLYDVSGKILWSQKGIVNQIAFDSYAPGVYYLEVVSSTGQSIQKVVKN